MGTSLKTLLSSLGVAGSFYLFERLREEYGGDKESLTWVNNLEKEWIKQSNGYTREIIGLGGAAVAATIVIFSIKRMMNRCRN